MLNNYFSYTVHSYCTGTVHSTLPVLGAGEVDPLFLVKSSISGGIIVELQPSVAVVDTLSQQSDVVPMSVAWPVGVVDGVSLDGYSSIPATLLISNL